ncbi:DUF4249 domain-containing protein [Hymenobacter terrestris]|uniref:DUF4249 domain-containing protein n=1 Tax=Hymenobacter terrestris TaxID=2748310 RepID=A0ABX2Q1F3_9BACT|nr:DUF4249 domain-containing protein [Hymenobacter terrestris]NVO84769.1 DUF4249 domain-containing protein [Hymenobacter terrestris]
MKTPATFLRGLLAIVLLLPIGCVEPYAPDVIDAPPSLLVVDGFINAAGPTTIRLSRTASLAATITPPPEARARLVIEQQNGPNYPLTETTLGTYVSAANVLPAGSLCRLRITTGTGKEYASDFVPVKLTPPIETLRWTPANNQVNVLVSTRDDTGASQYYRWEYEQTWEITPPYRPSVEYVKLGSDTGFMRRIAIPYPTLCWTSNKSTRILLSQTTALSQDIVVDFRVQGLSAGSPELNTRYSILVRQQALTAAEYTYWEQLRKNTENIGSLFDPQPSQSVGNVRSLSADDASLVLGFVGAHSVTEKRQFISYEELPSNWSRSTGYEACLPPDTVFLGSRGLDPPSATPAQIQFLAFASQLYLPIDAIPNLSSAVAFTAKKRDCVDCRTRGTAVRPSFW